MGKPGNWKKNYPQINNRDWIIIGKEEIPQSLLQKFIQWGENQLQISIADQKQD